MKYARLLFYLLPCYSLIVAAPETTSSQANNDQALKSMGQQKFEAICMACHKYQPESPMLAPPIFAVKNRYNRTYDDDKAWIDAVVSYVQKPSIEASIMPGAQKKFGLMPALPLPEEDLRAIAEFLRTTDFKHPNDSNCNESTGKRKQQRRKGKI